jgi:hypothetical protein
MDGLLKPTFATVHVAALLKHYQAMIAEFQQAAWEEAIGKGGKFVEAVLKALWLHTGNTLPPARQFKVDTVMNQLPNAAASFGDSVRLTIPRACRFIYDVASNRGARHDPSEVDPNSMDAHAVVAGASWVLGELVRYAQKGSLNPDDVKVLVDAITEKKYPVVEDVDGRTYFHTGKSARDVALLLLWRKHPGRINREDLVEAVHRHNYSAANATMAVVRLTGLLDVDGSGGLRLLQPGVREAERLMAAAQTGSQSKPDRLRRRRRAKRRRAT